jgi:hypothetical protein
MAGETLCLALYRHCRRCNCSVSFGCLAQYEANQFVNNFATLGNQFKRVVTDWGRLAAVGGPIARGQLVWDPTATSVFLRAFDITTRRQFYPTLMRANPNYLIAYVKYGDVQYHGRDDYNVYNKSQHTPSGDPCNQQKFWMAQDAGG